MSIETCIRISVETLTRLVCRSMAFNAINGSLEVLAMLPQLEIMYASTIIRSERSRPDES